MGDVEDQKALVEEAVNFHHEGMWPSRVSKHCCIYRVPSELRRVNPDAYTPRMLLIGPLHHYKKAVAAKIATQYFPSLDYEQTKSRYLGYLTMEHQKEVYLDAFAKRVGTSVLEHIETTIQKNEELIRQCYAESTDWIKSNDFVGMILLDSVFILEFILRRFGMNDSVSIAEFILRRFVMNVRCKRPNKDFLVDTPCLRCVVDQDLILLENQLPYFLLEKLFNAIPSCRQLTFRKLVLFYFNLQDKIKDTKTFKHFTDLLRCARVETLDSTSPGKECKETIKDFYNACKLHNSGVKFEPVEQKDSLKVEFEEGTGCLRMPSIIVDDGTELKLRNIMAFEQCHCPHTSYVCSHILFLDYLIDTDKDVELLVEKGIIGNCIGHHGSVAEMVNKLSLGVVEHPSSYADIAKRLNAYCKNSYNKSRAILCRVYFANVWKGTATSAAILLLIMTLLQTVASIIQVLQGFKE